MPEIEKKFAYYSCNYFCSFFDTTIRTGP